MTRREFFVLLGGTVLWPVYAHGQSMPVIGFVIAGSPESYADRLVAFRHGLAETGHREGENIAIEYRWSRGDNEKFPTFVADLISRRVSLIVTSGATLAALAAKAAGSNTPIVFALGSDPMKFGLVESMDKPGGNVTGVTFLVNSLIAKQTEVMRFSLLVNPTNPNAEADTNEARTAAAAIGVKLIVIHAIQDRDIDRRPSESVGGWESPPDALR